MTKLSKRQENILDFIKDEVRKKAIPLPCAKLVKQSALLQVPQYMVI